MHAKESWLATLESLGVEASRDALKEVPFDVPGKFDHLEKFTHPRYGHCATIKDDSGNPVGFAKNLRPQVVMRPRSQAVGGEAVLASGDFVRVTCDGEHFTAHRD